MDGTKCLGTNCPIKQSCKRYTAVSSSWQSWFGEMPCEWFDEGNYFYCEMFWDNKPLKKYTMEQVKQELNVKKT